jgi:LysM repeat protein
MRDYYKRGIAFIIVFFTLTPIALITSIFALITVSSPTQTEQPGQVLAASHGINLINSPKNGVSVYASLPNSSPTIESQPVISDARAFIIDDYLSFYNSPLEPYSNYIVETADKYGLDFRLITAIAQQESNLCKKIPADSYNCWGWGIHSEGTLHFDSYKNGIETVSAGIRRDYINKGYLTVEDIMSKYTPSSPGSWASGVNTFMEEMQ